MYVLLTDNLKKNSMKSAHSSIPNILPTKIIANPLDVENSKPILQEYVKQQLIETFTSILFLFITNRSII